MSELPVLISDLTSILVIAAITMVICKKLNLPAVLGYILAGFLVGPVVDFIPTISDMAGIETWSDIGVIFLMFGLGLEFSIHKLGEVGVAGCLSAGIQAVGMGVVGFFLGLLLDWGTMNSVFLGVMLAMSSTMITLKSIEDLGLKQEKFFPLAMGTLVIEDIIAIFAMVILSTIAVSSSISGWVLAERLGFLLLYLAIWLIVGIYLIPTLMKRLSGMMNEEMMLIVSLALCFLMALLAEKIGLSTELGAFLAGSLLAGTVHAEKIEHLVAPCKNLFGAVFFVSVGFMVQPAMIVKYIGPILLLSVVSILGKLLFLTIGGVAAGKELKVSLQAAASQTQVGEFSFILAGLGQSLSVTGAFLYPIIVAVSVITTFTTPILLRLAGPMNAWLEKRLPQKWLDKISRDDSGDGSTPEKQRDWTLFLKSYFRTFLLYGILSVGVILLGVRLLHPMLLELLPDKSAAITGWLACGVMYVVLALLIPAMLRTSKRYFTALWLGSIYNRVMLIFLLILRILVAVLIATLPAFLIFQTNPLWLALIAVPIIYLCTRSRALAGRCLEVEARFLANYNERQLTRRFGSLDEGEIHHWLTEQLYVLTMECPTPYGQEGMPLHTLDWGNQERIKVIKIIRGRTHLNIPDGSVTLRSGDRVVIMGNDKAIDNFCLRQGADGLQPTVDAQPCTLKDYIESQQDVPEANQLLCCGITLDKSMPQHDKTIRGSGIKEDWCAFLIGLERELLPIVDPNPNLTLRSGDLLWVMGSQPMARRLVKLGLLDEG